MIRFLLQRRFREEGAIALATFAFIVFVGLVILLTLWGIAYTTGAYNALYSANQSAAYAAATVTRPSWEPKDTPSDQPLITCGRRARLQDGNNSYVTVCYDDPGRSDEAIDAAQQVLAASLGSSKSRPGPFGLYYDGGSSDEGIGSVRLVGPRGARGQGDLITIHEITMSPADARNLAEGLDLCPEDGIAEAGYIEDLEPIEVCWRLRDEGITYPRQYHAGVVVRSEAKLPLLPICSESNYCPTFRLQAVAAATLDRPWLPRNSWAGYFSS